MVSRSKYVLQYRKEQKALLPATWRETKVYMSGEAYDRLVEIAQSRQERLPVTIGYVLDFALAVLDGEQPEPIKREPSAPPKLEVSAEALLQAILASRFPEDTGAARLRQAAFVQLVAKHNARGEAPSSTDLAAETGGFRSQMDLLAKQLMGRGVITRKHASGHKGARSAKLLMIAENALEGLNEAHIAATGEPIEGLEVSSKKTRARPAEPTDDAKAPQRKGRAGSGKGAQSKLSRQKSR
jgi:hypothetical protein